MPPLSVEERGQALSKANLTDGGEVTEVASHRQRERPEVDVGLG
ncbi:hypothetical protein AERO9AM_10592 [Aeromicrobium sp. 9AM]|nr:hypothetical protein AERO9AM_10592 [Aeromicrobium sp. 9AM]